MGFFDLSTGSVISGRSSHSRRHSSHHSKKHSTKHRSRSRSSSRSRSKRHSAPSIAASIFGGDDYKKNNASRGSFFGIPNASRSSFFGFGGGRPSYYKRSPRNGFVQKTLKQVKRLWRDLVYYAKKHPYKVVALVIMPLITGGFLTALLARFGLRLPPGIERMIGIGAKAASGDSMGLVGEAVRMASGGFGGGAATRAHVERGYDGDYSWERRSVERDGGGGGGGGGWADGLMNGVAKMFV
ncbi:hypothetical protein CABS01_02266 [Colletotrichum abscissum]|uniref:Prenylated rab acceptor 1 n=1 Tax=Colletotrichum abscissum TaxID=1671311 RepID=A0A9P9X8G7_9PEZI|nr:uncharacterized protein CABS01_02266 [Colletotrichum abscissum]KAI3542048.1 hypothetical protein CABS02_10506 [Colletotrichum abscissum]KAK1488636.1 hypothetical protein CABS01_02266 [Colletotrichum abscissum]